MVDGSDVAVEVFGIVEFNIDDGTGRFHVKLRSFHFSKLSEQINGPRGINCWIGIVLVDVALLTVVIVVNELACCGEGGWV